jgi:hypothetical protein
VFLNTDRRPLAAQPGVLRDFLAHGPLRQELAQLLDVLEDASRRPTAPLGSALDVPLHLHADYQLAEIMAAFGVVTPAGTLERPQAGVRWLKQVGADLFFITLETSEKDYSPSTMHEGSRL